MADVGDSPALDRLLHCGLHEPLGDPGTELLLDKLDVLAFNVEAIDGFWRRSSDVADSAASPEVSQKPEFANVLVMLEESANRRRCGY